MSWDKLAGKVRPGTYNNFESAKVSTVKGGTRGVCLIPLINADYGPAKEWIKITDAAPDGQADRLGHSIYENDANMLLIEEALKGGASTVYVYICSSGTKATAKLGTSITMTAKYGGTRGNKLTVTVDAVPVTGDAAKQFDVIVSLDGSIVSKHEKAETLADLADDPYIDFSGTGDLAATESAGVRLAGGTDTKATAQDVSDYIDAWEKVRFNAACLPIDATANSDFAGLLTAAKTKIKYIRETIEHGGVVVAANFKGDYEGVVNVLNGYVASGRAFSAAEATAWAAGAYAGAGWQSSLTHRQVDQATACNPELDNEEIEAAINAGEFVFSMSEEGNVVAEYDINSLTTFTTKRDKTYRKNRIIRTLDAFNETIHLNFPPNKYDNDANGWDIMEGVGKSILKLYEEAGAISDVDYDNDFLVDRELSEGDETYFNVRIKPVDSAEKLFFTTKTE